jgi:hypothetical protein
MLARIKKTQKSKKKEEHQKEKREEEKVHVRKKEGKREKQGWRTLKTRPLEDKMGLEHLPT